MVHVQFVCPHGNNQVFLCSDFTGYVVDLRRIKYQQMVPVEGLDMTFMTICD
ncbi:hypothetical protein HanPI659440_Chr16g0636521 [Helianthus annuus]|nr:hypothetical protein HanPI659440_Chr16g0636521 [Helianthus annuus]